MASFEKLNTGWKFIVSYKDGDKYRRKTGNGFKTKKEAQVAAAEIEKKLYDRLDIYAGEKQFTEYYRDWVHTYKIGKFSKATDQQYQTAMKLVDKHFSGLRLNQITKMTYQNFINEYAKKRTLGSVKKVNNQIAGCLKEAFKNGHISIDVTYKIKTFGKVASQHESEKYLDEGDAKKLLDALRFDLDTESVNKYMAILQLATGARIGELMALTFDRIDYDKMTITIDRTWDYKFTNHFAPTKNKKERTISVDPQTMKLMKELYNDVRKKSLKSTIKNTKNLLFVNQLMVPPTVEGTNKMLKKICKENKIKEITSHNLRHTHASILLLHGLDIQYVASRLGDTPQVVSEVYAHLLAEMKEKGDQEASRITELLYVQ